MLAARNAETQAKLIVIVLVLAGDQSEIQGQRQLLKSVDGVRFTVDGQKKQYEDLNSKSQAPNRKQTPNSNFQNEGSLQGILFVLVIGKLEFGACLAFEIWCLEFNSSYVTHNDTCQ